MVYIWLRIAHKVEGKNVLWKLEPGSWEASEELSHYKSFWMACSNQQRKAQYKLIGPQEWYESSSPMFKNILKIGVALWSKQRTTCFD